MIIDGDGEDAADAEETLSKLEELLGVKIPTSQVRQKKKKENDKKGKKEKDDAADAEDDEILKFCERLESEYEFKASKDKNRELYRYDKYEGGWTPDDAEAIIEEELEKIDPNISTHTVSEVIEKIRRRNYTDEPFVGAIIEEDDDCWLHHYEGWVNMDTGKVESHTPKRLSTRKIAAKYDPNAVCFEFTRMITKALPELEYRRRLLKAAGNVLVPDARYEKAVMFVGEGHNRKGSTLFAIEQALGADNVCSVTLQELAEDRFAAARLHNKMANLVTDIDTDRITRSGWFKKLVSGDLIEAQFKYQNAFKMRSAAKSFYSANIIPVSDDQTYAYFRRWEIIVFYVLFDRDATLQKRLSTEQEKSGVLNLMLAGRKLLLKEGFDETSIERVRFLYNQNASIARDFLMAKCAIDLSKESDETYITKTTVLQDAYVDWCIEHRHKSKEDKDGLIRQLGEDLNKLGVENKRRGPRDKREHYYIGIALRSELEKMQTTLDGAAASSGLHRCDKCGTNFGSKCDLESHLSSGMCLPAA